MNTKSYVVWNNKGGVGKSTLTFHIASTYAEKNPDVDVVVVDMCPQANSTCMLIGGGRQSEEVLEELMSKEDPRTIVGYLASSISNQNAVLKDYVLKLVDYNTNLTSNLYLLSGDGNLELLAPLLSERANATPLNTKDKPWVKVHNLIRDLTDSPLNKERETVYFIDTNPSFSIYTQLAIVGGDIILVPINADDSSIFAITGLFNLVWGGDVQHPLYGNYTFATKAKERGLRLPKIGKLLGNRFTQLLGAANAFKALSNEAISKMFEEYKKHPSRFLSSSGVINSLEDFESEYSVELRDFNSAGVVAANQGIPLSRLDKDKYTVYGQKIQVNKKQRELCKSAIGRLADSI